MTLALVRATFADIGEAERIARILLDERLAACVNIDPSCRSIYRWQDTVEQAIEVAALFKTRADLAESLTARLTALHSYALPAVEHWTADASPELLAWIDAATR